MKRFGRNQRRALRERIAELENSVLLGLEPAQPDDFDFTNIIGTDSRLCIDEQWQRRRDVTLELSLVTYNSTLPMRVLDAVRDGQVIAWRGARYRAEAISKDHDGPRLTLSLIGIGRRQ